ncbi:hypothetical protein [Taibaiella chishuiensis]|uniref:Uncharacterized protein n=1 Tax=Taibaiella chishuiensis TaxID=1434707 RepID=A0A2P8D0P8_9BACT|nr:hypothetical protein [Taibaiella chishuiensis]PSK90787.1 hypothetical protein B0I18_107199 [Taibaiella chishuiensis]
MIKNLEKRTLPQTDIAGTKFLANSITGEFIQVENSENQFSIFDMIIHDNHLEMLFDKSTCRPYEGNWSEAPESENLQYVWLRPVSQLDPDGMNIMLEGGLIKWEEYYPGELPTVKIHDTLFYIDPERKGFREVENRWNIIPFNDVVSHDKHGIYYDKRSKNSAFLINPFDPPKSLPEHIVFAELPPVKEFVQIYTRIKTKQDIAIERKHKVYSAIKRKNKKGRRT